MKMRYRLVRRGERNTFYCFDTATKKRTSLETADPREAQRIIDAKNDSLRQPSLNPFVTATDRVVSEEIRVKPKLIQIALANFERWQYASPSAKTLSFQELKRREARSRMPAIRRARRSPQAAAKEQRRASLLGRGAKWRITNLNQVARAIAKWP